MKKVSIPNYSIGEEIINSTSHGVGACLSLMGLILLVIKAQTKVEIITTFIFGFTLIFLYTISCIYHGLSKDKLEKKYLRVLDHCSVFLLVAGTYMPLSLIGIGGKVGLIMFFSVFIITMIGIVCNIINIDKFQLVSVICHLVTGWASLLMLNELLEGIHIQGVMYLILGGLMYSIGAFLYRLGKHRKYMHSIFHFFCLGGSFFHFLMIYLCVL